MEQGQQRATLRGTLLLLLILWTRSYTRIVAQELDGRGDKKFGDKCNETNECGFEGSVCDEIARRCHCSPELPVTNHMDKCGVAAKVNETCVFTEQCESSNSQTECKENICTCRFGKVAIFKPDGQAECTTTGRGDKKFGDKCNETNECGFEGSVCDEIARRCHCSPELPVTNHIDKCGVAAKLNETCVFTEQCEKSNFETECKESICTCRFGKVAIFKPDGQAECTTVIDTRPTHIYHVDPAMIGILVAMFLMFITICVVLRLFSKARWRENRTIFNTPNPRLMNASLLKENKHLHERRGSRTSRGPSRQPSMASLRPHSPISQGSRRGSRGSSNASAASVRSNKSPPQTSNLNSATTPMLESVTVEVQQSKA